MQHPMIQSIKELKGYPVDLKNFSTQKGFIVMSLSTPNS